MVTKEFKKRVIDKLKELEVKSGLSASRFAVKIGINQAQWSRLKKGEFDGVLADGRFISLARQNDVQMGEQQAWNTARTHTFSYISNMLKTCQEQSVSALFVDNADIGKTYTATHYCRNNQNALYIDCSQVKSKQLFVREIARQMGVSHTNKYADVYRDLVFMMNSTSMLLIILDEAGDLNYDAFLELKGLWNATEGSAAWVMMGADGLKQKINRAIATKKVGYTEIFRRYGSNFRQATPIKPEELEQFNRDQATAIAKVNAPSGVDIQKLIVEKTDRDQSNKTLKTFKRFSLTNVHNRIMVLNKTKQTV